MCICPACVFSFVDGVVCSVCYFEIGLSKDVGDKCRFSACVRKCGPFLFFCLGGFLLCIWVLLGWFLWLDRE